MPRTYKDGVCTVCSKIKPVAARGMCRACYNRWRENGTAGYVRQFRDKTCRVEGCNNRAHGQGLCTKHLQRLRRTGTVEEGRSYTMSAKPEELISQHDLYPIWREFKRPNNPRPVVAEWRESFGAFTAAVGERPGRRYRLHPIRRDEPLGPGNFIWKEAIIERQNGETLKEYEARYKREHRRVYQTSYHDSGLLLKYGITRDRYLEMFAEQGGVCAICKQPETAKDKNGEIKAMAVDHCHKTGKVRSLLCYECNTGIGKLKEDPNILQAAIAYLAKHAASA